MSAEGPPKPGRAKRRLGLGLSRNHTQTQGRGDAATAGAGLYSAITPNVSPATTGWSVLKRILEVVRDASDICLPLKASLVGVVELMNLVEARAIPV